MTPTHPHTPTPPLNQAQLQAALAAQAQPVTEFLCDLIRFPSTRGNEGPIIRYLHDRLKDQADECELVPIAESITEDVDYSFPLAGMTYADRPNLRIVRKGTGAGKSILFNTHVDVVPPSQGQERPFEPQVRDGVVFGRGACDAKGQIAALFAALRVLNEWGLPLQGDVTFHLVIEEECGGNGTLAFIRGSDRADACVVLEPSDLTILPFVRGAVWFVVTCYGRSGHSGRAGQVVSALKKAIQAMDLLEGYHDRLLAASRGFNPYFDQFENPMPITFGQMEAGDWPATAPNRAVFKGVLGFLPNKTHPEVQAELRQVIQEEGDEWLRNHFEMDFIYRHDGHEIPADHPLVETLKAACQASGREPKISAMTASCDAWFYNNQLHIPTVVFGPGSLGFAHTNEEQIAVADILKGAEVLVNFLAEWCGEKGNHDS